MTEWIQCGDTLHRPLRMCFSSVNPSVPSLFCTSPWGNIASHGKGFTPSNFYSRYYSYTKRGVYIYIYFSPSKQTLGRLVWAEAYFFNQGACSLSICLIMSQPFSLLSLAGAQHGSPPSICCFVQPCRNNRFIKGQFDWKHKESFGSLSCASGYQDL